MKLKILILASLLFLVNQVNALSIGGGDIFSADWFVGLNLAENSIEQDLIGESIWTVDSFDPTSLVLDMEAKITLVIDDGLDGAAFSLFPEEFQISEVPFEQGRCVDNECSTIPEPAMVGLLVIGLLGMVAGRHRLRV